MAGRKKPGSANPGFQSSSPSSTTSKSQGTALLHPDPATGEGLSAADLWDQPTGQDARDDGAAAALDATWPIWRLAAQEHLEVLAGDGREFTADDLVDEVGMPPVTGSPNAIGGLFIGAINTGLIVPVGYSRSRRRARRAGVQRVYRGAP